MTKTTDEIPETPLRDTEQFVDQPTFWGDRRGLHQPHSELYLGGGNCLRLWRRVRSYLAVPKHGRQPAAAGK